MSLRFRRSLAAAIAPLLLSITPPFVHGQAVVPAARPDPLNPRSEVPATTYKSALGRYRPAGEVKVGSWRDANDTVTRIGGWRTYTREANQPEGADAPAAPASAPASSSPAAPAPAPAVPVAPTAPAASGPAPTPARPAGGHGHHGKR